ncbi:N-acetyltransferase 1 isoform X1 [Tachypleus tridentatus]|uniref:N-acetyltransferase 1 isoform X1 n=1 Tax=Tachypleus tridentatus TaxID=6853 RepID=UPI003FD08F26
MYALLCRKLCEEAPNFDPPSNSSFSGNTFRRLLLAKCQDEFENRRKASEAFDKRDGPLTPEEEEQRGIAKHKMLGNIKFIGELGKQGLLHEAILHQCIQQLLAKKKRQGVKDTAEDLECLCQIMKTVGRRLDIDKARSLMNQYFDRMQTFAENNDLPSRIRFMLQDVLELRRKKWVPRRVLAEQGPRTIHQIREEAAKDYGVYTPNSCVIGGRNMQVPTPPLVMGVKGRGGMDDVFGPLPLGVGNLGTGPGVIPADGFHSYSGNMGRPNRANMNNSAGFLGVVGSSPPFFGQNRANQPPQNRDRDQDLFPAFQQRQQNQNQTPGGFSGSGSNRELPPRFLKKALQQQPGSADEISLRPAQNSMVLKPKASPTNNLMKGQSRSSSAPQPGNGPSSPLVRELSPNSGLVQKPITTNPLHPKEGPIVIKQTFQEKNKTNKQGPGKEEVLKKSDQMISELFKHQNTEEASIAFKDIKVPKKFIAEVLYQLMVKTLEKSENDRELLCGFFVELKKTGQLKSSAFLEALKLVSEQISELEADVPRVKSYVAAFAARGISDNLATLGEVAEPLEGRAHYPMFLLCLQHLHKVMGRRWLTQVFNESKIHLLSMLRESDRTKERLADILEDRGLSFLLPLLRIQSDLWKQIQADPSPTTFYKWIKDNVDSSQFTASGFIYALASCLIKFITMETTLSDNTDNNSPPEKVTVEQEKELLEKFKPVFDAFLTENTSLQLVVLYALQVYCFNQGFPKGMLLRWFMNLYDLEIIEEDAFLTWKEDVNDEYPGKGKALFQVNQWLTWLEEAEEEDGSDEGEN